MLYYEPNLNAAWKDTPFLIVGKSIRDSKHNRFSLCSRVRHTSTKKSSFMMSVISLTLIIVIVQAGLLVDLTAGVFSQDATGDIVWDRRSSVLPNQAGPATGKLFTFT